MRGWIEAFAVVSSTHQDEFELVFVEAVDPHDATICVQHGLARARDPYEDGLLLLAVAGSMAAHRGRRRTGATKGRVPQAGGAAARHLRAWRLVFASTAARRHQRR